jgi:ADP-ribosylglycohydrolase
MKINLLDKFQGCLFGVAIGDTLGHPFEGKLRSQIHSYFDNFSEFIEKNPSIFRTYTDDTQLTLHLAEALIKGEGFNLDYIIKEFINWLGDPPIGPGYGCISSIRKLQSGVDWEQAASNSHPAASAGAIVIANAIAFLINKNPESGFSVDEFFDVIIGSISNSQDEIWEEFIKILQKLKSALDIRLESGLIKFSQAGVKSPYFIEHYLGKAFVHPYTISTVVCAIFIFLKRLTSFKDCILELATAGGDSDTVGAIGGSLAGAYFGLQNIPPDLVNLVKDNKQIFKISENLYNTFKKRFY